MFGAGGPRELGTWAWPLRLRGHRGGGTGSEPLAAQPWRPAPPLPHRPLRVHLGSGLHSPCLAGVTHNALGRPLSWAHLPAIHHPHPEAGGDPARPQPPHPTLRSVLVCVCVPCVCVRVCPVCVCVLTQLGEGTLEPRAAQLPEESTGGPRPWSRAPAGPPARPTGMPPSLSLTGPAPLADSSPEDGEVSSCPASREPQGGCTAAASLGPLATGPAP